ncbi:MAG: alpha/beta fold hydrolase [Gemmatimonadales bacterium]|nr:alpha/beta fold hydrolase [Gemmatimonadales bacterium]
MVELAAVELVEGISGRIQPGPGDRILWLHGYTLDSSSWSEMWRRLPGWHHIGIDLPGHGASAPIWPGLNLQVLARRLGQFCQKENVRHIVALSFGTQTATQLAIEYPSYFSSVILGAPSLAGGPQDPRIGSTYAKLQQLYHEEGPGPAMKSLWMSCVAWNGVKEVPGLEQKLGALVARHRWEELRNAAMMQFFEPPQREEDLRRIRSPVLLLVGELEMQAFRECAAILERCLPLCRRHELPRTHHLCMLESPALSAPPIEAHLRAHAAQQPPVDGTGRVVT